MAMSSVRRHRLVCSVVLAVCCWFAGAQAQNRSQLFEQFQNHQVEALLQSYRHRAITMPDWRQFLALIQQSNADSAVAGYFRLFNRTHDQQLQHLIRQRIAQFYSIQGFYETARRVETDPVFFRKLQGIKKQQQIHYGVQLAAFSRRENALRKKQALSASGLATRVIAKQKNGQALFVLIHGDFESKEAATRAMKTIRKKFNLKGYVVEY